jgi:hypothetical protein
MPSTKEVLRLWAEPVSCFNVDHSKINFVRFATVAAHRYSSEQLGKQLTLSKEYQGHHPQIQVES